MAITDDTAPPLPKGPSLVIQIVVLLVLTLAAVGLGWVAGMYLKGEAGPQAETAAAPAADDHAAPMGEHAKPDEGHAEEGDHGPAPAGPLIVDLLPITTNLTAPSDVWVRMEATLVFDAPQPPELALVVHQDLLAYMRTLKLHQIEGASGYQHLKADLAERARIRSDGHVTQVLIRTLLFE
jgi:flagellar FliL protein